MDLIDARDLAFLLYEVLDAPALTRRPRFADHSRETFDAVLETARKIAEQQFRPHNRKGDEQPPHLVDGTVRIIPEVGEALAAVAEAGLLAAHHDYELDGSQLPWVVTQACHTQFYAANLSTFAYAFLTIAAGNLLRVYGSEEQQRLYLRPMLAGRFFGTMAMSEPDAGSSLADVRTRAEPTGDGHYRITGTKMWISGGEHELARNIVHLVLARVAGAPAGVKGLSLFLVPRFRLDAAGEPAESNDVALAGLNHKLGYRGTVNTLLSFGEGGDCRGWLVGPEGQGMACMFHMMNEARIVVGLSAAALGCAGYRVSLDYARNRPQGRPPQAKDPTTPPVPIIRHADVRRMLLAQKAAGEGALMLGLYLAWLVDQQKTAPDDAVRRESGLLLDLLTPVMKAWSAETCLAANSHAIQILGGYGYTREFPVEQYWRDNRLNPIHEGTNGIQAIDLLGRKVTMQQGAALSLLLREIARTTDEARGHAELAEAGAALAAAAQTVATTTARLVAALGERGAEIGLANAAAYLEMVGHLVSGWMWLWQAVAAQRRDPAEPFYRGKLQTCRYVFRWELPKLHTLAAALAALDTTSLEMEDAWF